MGLGLGLVAALLMTSSKEHGLVPLPLKYKVELNESERTRLKQIASRGETSARKVKRALVLLKADEGLTDRDIASSALRPTPPEIVEVRGNDPMTIRNAVYSIQRKLGFRFTAHSGSVPSFRIDRYPS